MHFIKVRGVNARPNVTILVSFAPKREPQELPVTRKDGYVEDASLGESSMICAFGRQDLFPAAFLAIITVLKSALPLVGCG